MNDVLDAALDLAQQQGLPVFPCTLDKVPTIKDWAHNASTDPARITGWSWVNRLIGVPTGSISGMIALDIDWRNNGDVWAIANMAQIPITRIHMSRSDGAHFIFEAPDTIVSSSNSRIAPGVDVQAEGKQIIWWPAHGFDTFNYDLPRAVWPSWLDELNSPPKPPKPSTKHIAPGASGRVDRSDLIGPLKTVAGAKNGERNSCLHWAACRFGEIPGLSESDAIEMLVSEAVHVGLDPHEAERTARSGFRRTRNSNQEGG